ncbi:MAG: hypothetical protein AB7H43_02655 [Acidimicrobiia bacterium]
MTATLTDPISPLRTGRPAGAVVRGHLPRHERRVPLQVVARRPVAVPPVVVQPVVVRPAVVYRRRRLVALVVGLVLVVSVVATARLGLAWLGDGVTAGGTSPTPAVVVAEPGDSYWSLAAGLDVGGDVRSTVDALVRANGGRELRIGDRIVLR